MNEEIFIYKPKRMLVGVLCIVLFILLVGNIYLLLEWNAIWLYLPLLVLSIAFVFFVYPVIKNQRIMLSGKRMFLLTFGQSNKIDIEKDLEEVVLKEGEVVSYRFEKNGLYFQVSPSSYYENTELNNNLDATLKRYNLRPRVILK